MRVSVIVPLYNKARFISQCLESVLSQTYKDFEVIVVDDNSTDRSLEIAENYPIKVLRVSNRGPAGARNAGIMNSIGEFILPLDADDWIDAQYLSKTVPMMQDGIGVVSTDMQRFGSQYEMLPAKIMSADQELAGNEIPCCSLVRKKAILQVGGYNSKTDGYEDWHLWVDILRGGWQMAVVNEPLFHYRCGENGMNTFGDSRREELIKRIRTV